MQPTDSRSKRSLGVAVALVICAVTASSSFAQTSASSASPGSAAAVGVVDVQRALRASAAFKQAQEKLESFSSKQQSALESQQAELRKKVEEFQSQRSVLEAAALREREIELAQLRNKLEREAQTAAEAVQAQEQKLLGPILGDVQKAIRVEGDAQGIGIILNTQTPGLLYTGNARDITDAVIARLNP